MANSCSTLVAKQIEFLMARTQSTSEQQSVRVLKVGERVRHILSELLARGEAHDDVLRAHTISVTEVRMTPDLRNRSEEHTSEL